MDYSTIKVKIKRGNYYEIIQSELLQYANYIDETIDKSNFLDALLTLETIKKLAIRFRNIIEKENRPKQISFSISESVILIKVFNYKTHNALELGTSVMQLLVSELQQKLFSRLI